jgi:hypothetical protein
MRRVAGRAVLLASAAGVAGVVGYVGLVTAAVPIDLAWVGGGCRWDR